MRHITLVIGPTGSGKSDVAEALIADQNLPTNIPSSSHDLTAHTLHPPTHIINADSQQVYSSLPIIRAAPQPQSHHSLYGFLRDDQSLNAADWALMAFEHIQKHSIIVGGTALYIQTLIEGIPPAPHAPLTPEIKALPIEELKSQVYRCDPQFHFRDRQRLERALAVYKHTHTPLTTWQKQPRKQFPIQIHRIIYTAIPQKEKLFQRILQMINLGALDEVRKLQTFPSTTIPIGLQPALEYLSGRISREIMVTQWTNQMYQYARRQHTLFKKIIKRIWPNFSLNQG